ncbi:MAG: hypothetical protein ACJAV5_000900 [Vicingaceae bacterium]|jgi:hypothetical protein
MSLAIKGRIKTILDVESGTSKAGKGWRKQSFVVDTGAQYNPDVCFGVFGDDKIEMLARFNAGAEVEVSFNVSSREYNGKYYHNIDAWKIDPIGSQAPSGSTPPPPSEEPNSMNTADLSSDAEDDDLPF